MTRQLDILTESAGRVNFNQLDGNHIGLGVSPYYDGKPLINFNIQPLPMKVDFIKRISNVTTQLTDDNIVYPCFFKGSLKLDQDVNHDSFVDVLSSKF